MEALSSGHATPEGFIDAQLHQFYQERARGGVGALIIETCLPLPPVEPIRHLGLYADAHVPGLRACIRAIQDEGCGVLVMLDQPGGMRDLAEQDIVETFALAAWRALAAGADGIMLSAADDGPFLHLCEPGIGEIRLATMLHVVEACIGWLGRRCIVGVRLAVEEHVPGGLTLQDTRVVARRLTSAGARLIEITVRVGSDAVVAQFPGWQTPVAAAVKAVVEAPVIVGGELDDVVLAEYALLDSCADLIAVGERLRVEPDWPLKIQALAKR
jgi:NADPH2 dehydrogenase